MSIINPETLHEDRLIEEAMDSTPLVFSESEYRQHIRNALWYWKTYGDPAERAAFFVKLKWGRENQSKRTSATKEGGCISGEVPAIVDRCMTAVTNDAKWLYRNSKIIGWLFDEFPEGRYAYWEGRGEGPSRLSLTEADRRYN